MATDGKSILINSSAKRGLLTIVGTPGKLAIVGTGGNCCECADDDDPNNPDPAECCLCTGPADEYEDDGDAQGMDFTVYPLYLCKNGGPYTMSLVDGDIDGGTLLIEGEFNNATVVVTDTGGGTVTYFFGDTVFEVDFGPSTSRTVTIQFELTETVSEECLSALFKGGIFEGDGRMVLEYAAFPCTDPLTINEPTYSIMQEGIAITPFSAVGSGGTPPYTYSVFSGSLPAGLTLNSSSGVISGTPTTQGTGSTVFRVTDDIPDTADSSSRPWAVAPGPIE